MNSMDIKIKRGIPIPENANALPRKYPLDRMKKGDMFEVALTKGARNRIYSSVMFFLKTHPNHQFRIVQSKKEGLVKCWRTK